MKTLLNGTKQTGRKITFEIIAVPNVDSNLLYKYDAYNALYAEVSFSPEKGRILTQFFALQGPLTELQRQ